MAKRRRSSYYNDYWPRYTSTKPIAVSDGIKAKSKHGKFVSNWWATRWIKSLTRLMDSKRLSRGRSYARRGQVREISIKPGHIMARVQGSRRSPYKVNIELKPLSDRQWNTVFDMLGEQAIFAAQLLNGEMPQDIEQIFDAAQAPLFPTAKGDLHTACSCPDWANPCKHIAAVYYLLGEQFDNDPFLLFELRGRDKKEVAVALRQRRMVTVVELSLMTDEIEAVETVPLEACLDCYWDMGAAAREIALNLAAPQVEMNLLKRLGIPDFLEAKSFWGQMERVYEGLTDQALDMAFE